MRHGLKLQSKQCYTTYSSSREEPHELAAVKSPELQRQATRFRRGHSEIHREYKLSPAAHTSRTLLFVRRKALGWNVLLIPAMVHAFRWHQPWTYIGTIMKMSSIQWPFSLSFFSSPSLPFPLRNPLGGHTWGEKEDEMGLFVNIPCMTQKHRGSVFHRLARL